MKKTFCLFLIAICLLSLASCAKGDAPYTPIPENTEGLNMGGSINCGVLMSGSFEEYAQSSELAVECEYVGPYEYMRLERDDVQRNFTYSRFRVISVLRGELSESEIIVRTDGGAVYFKNGEFDGISDEYSWTPDFKEGDRFILFLNKGSRLDRFCIDSEYYNFLYNMFHLNKNTDKYCISLSPDVLPLTSDARGEIADNYCFTADELKALLDDIAAPIPPSEEQERLEYNVSLEDKKLSEGKSTEEMYESVKNAKIYDYARIVVRHKAQ
ncbi:MAG: hypothetical protein IJ408_04825 [Clostridia bacterium]|nr:hypothetical protein [Clostridia bacterium]